MHQTDERERLTPWRSWVEAVLSAVAVVLTLLLPVHYIGSHLCAWGECSVPGDQEIRVYRIVVATLAATVVATFVMAIRRRARWAFAWHTLVALVGLTAALVFAMPSVDWRSLNDRDPASPNSGYVPCHSGTPHDCPGG